MRAGTRVRWAMPDKTVCRGTIILDQGPAAPHVLVGADSDVGDGSVQLVLWVRVGALEVIP